MCKVFCQVSLTNQTTQGHADNLDRSLQYQELEEDSEDGRGEAEDDEVPDGHQRDGGQAGEAHGGHQQTVEGDRQPLTDCYGVWLGVPC